MKPLLCISDLHIGVNRTGGTTPASAQDLREWLVGCYGELLCLGGSGDVVINGDMFDSYNIPAVDLLGAYSETVSFLDAAPEAKLFLVPGNHDLSKNSSQLSSFELFARILYLRYPDRVEYLAGGNWVRQDLGVYAISHVANQELFDEELGFVPDGTKYLLLHCNFDNPYAADAEHSLNLSREQAKVLAARDIKMILGHEHQGRTLMGGKVVIVGNQIPSSVSDCLPLADQRDGKYCLEIDAKGITHVPTWDADNTIGGFLQVDWTELDTVKPGRRFIRVTGRASAGQGADVVRAISKLRQSVDAFVITNAVKIDEQESLADVVDSITNVKALSVVELLMEMLDEPQRAVVQSLLKEKV